MSSEFDEFDLNISVVASDFQLNSRQRKLLELQTQRFYAKYGHDVPENENEAIYFYTTLAGEIEGLNEVYDIINGLVDFNMSRLSVMKKM